MEGIKGINSPELRSLATRYSNFVKEIRRRILFTLSVFLIATLAGFIFYEKIIKFLIGTLSLGNINVVFTSPFQFINLAITTGLSTGLVLVFPLIIYQILSFLKPALKEKEYKMIVRIFPFSIFLFIAGFLFGALIMKWQIQIFLEKSISLGIGNVLDISSLLTTIITTSSLMGIGFQFPILLLLLMRMGLIKRNTLSKQRPWVYLGSFIFAILLPVDSILADVLLSLPLILLFEISLLLSKRRR